MFINVTNNTSYHQNVSVGATVLYCIIMAAILTTAIFGNCLVLIAVKRTKSLRNTAAILVVNLACVDLTVTVCVVPFVIVTAAAQQWVLPTGVCIATGFLNSFLTAAQIMALLHISVNRYLAVSHPHSYDTKLSKKITVAMVTTGWIYSFFWTHMPFYGWGEIGFIENTLFCNILWSQHLSFAVTAQVLCYFIPCIIAGVLYLGTYLNVRKHWQRAKKRSQSTLSLGETNFPAVVTQSTETVTVPVTQSAIASPNAIELTVEEAETIRATTEAARAAKRNRKRKRTLENRVTKTLLGVAIAFAVCWFPRGVANLWSVFAGRNKVPLSLEYVSTAFVFLNSSVNPAIYGALNQDFYKAFISILSCQTNKGRTRSETDHDMSASMSAAKKV